MLCNEAQPQRGHCYPSSARRQMPGRHLASRGATVSLVPARLCPNRTQWDAVQQRGVARGNIASRAADADKISINASKTSSLATVLVAAFFTERREFTKECVAFSAT